MNGKIPNKFRPYPLPNTNDGGAGGGGEGGASGAGGDQSQQQQQQQQQQAPTRPDYLPESYWDAEKNAPKAEDIGKVFAAHEARTKNAIPDWEKHELRTTVKGLDDTDIVIKRDDPLVKAFGAITTKHGLGADVVQDLLDTVATAQKADSESVYNEFLKTGGGDRQKAEQRAQAVIEKGARMLGYTGEKGADGKVDTSVRDAVQRLLSNISTAADFEVFEKMVNAASAPGAAPAGGGGVIVDLAKKLYPNEGKRA